MIFLVNAHFRDWRHVARLSRWQCIPFKIPFPIGFSNVALTKISVSPLFDTDTTGSPFFLLFIVCTTPPRAAPSTHLTTASKTFLRFHSITQISFPLVQLHTIFSFFSALFAHIRIHISIFLFASVSLHPLLSYQCYSVIPTTFCRQPSSNASNLLWLSPLDLLFSWPGICNSWT